MTAIENDDRHDDTPEFDTDDVDDEEYKGLIKFAWTVTGALAVTSALLIAHGAGSYYAGFGVGVALLSIFCAIDIVGSQVIRLIAQCSK